MARSMHTKRGYSWFVVFINGIIGVSMTSLFPQFTMVVGELAEKMNTTEEFLLLTDSIKAFAIMGGMFCSGLVYNKIGLRSTFLVAMICMVLPQMILPNLTSAMFVIPLKILQGFSAIIFPVFIIIIVEWSSENRVGMATAVFNGIFYGGAGVGAALCGIAITKFGWEASFHVTVLMILIPGIIWLLFVQEKNQHKRFSIKSSDKGLDQFLVTIKRREVWLLTLCFLSTIWMLQVLTVDLPLFSQYLGYNNSQSGVAMSAITFGIFAATLSSGKISDLLANTLRSRVKARLLVMTIGPVITIVVLGVIFLLDLTSFSTYYGVVFMLSFGSAWGLGAFYCILPEVMETKALDFATGLIGGTADIGMPIGPYVVGVLFGIHGLWNFAGLACLLIGGLSALGCFLMIRLQNGESSECSIIRS